MSFRNSFKVFYNVFPFTQNPEINYLRSNGNLTISSLSSSFRVAVDPLVDFRQFIVVECCEVDLCGLDGLMPEQFTDHLNGGTCIFGCCSPGVPEGIRGDVTSDIQLPAEFLKVRVEMAQCCLVFSVALVAPETVVTVEQVKACRTAVR